MPARVTLQGWKRPSADLIVCVPYRVAAFQYGRAFWIQRIAGMTVSPFGQP